MAANAALKLLAALRRSLYDHSGSPFRVDFTDRGAAQIVFDEGQGSLLTDGTRACMERDHIQYDQPLDSHGTHGLLLKLDNVGVQCGHDAQIAVGHLASWDGYGFGDFEWVARVHHSPDGGPPPANSFCCFSTYVHGSLTHNEVAWCFPANDGKEVHMAYWCVLLWASRHCERRALDPPSGAVQVRRRHAPRCKEDAC